METKERNKLCLAPDYVWPLSTFQTFQVHFCIRHYFVGGI